MKMVPAAVTKTVARTVLKTQKHSPTILFGSGVVGIGATIVLACKATLKLDEILQESEKKLQQADEVARSMPQRYSEIDKRKDVAYIRIQTLSKVCKLYMPTIIVGVASVAALTGSHHILKSRNANLTAAYAALQKGMDEYRKRVADELGEDRERELRYGYEEHEVVSEGAHGPEVQRVKRVSPNGASIYARFFDEMCPDFQRTPEYNMLFLKCQQDYANDKLRARGHVFLNEVYDSLGLERSKAGAVVGWVLNADGRRDNYIDFGIFDANRPGARDFVNGREGAILLDFNVDGNILDLI